LETAVVEKSWQTGAFNSKEPVEAIQEEFVFGPWFSVMAGTPHCTTK
jgi:hypothetical protein